MKPKIIFQKETDNFLSTLQSRVNTYFINNGKSKYGNRTILLKYLTLKLTIIIVYYLMIISENSILSFLCFSILGPLFVTLLLNVSHDAIHGIAHINNKLNSYLRYQMDLFGANSFLWKSRHKAGHHSFPNIVDKDPDLKQTLIVKIFPSSKTMNFHKYQHIYVPILYSVYTINWVFIRDFKDLFDKITIRKISSIEIFKFIFFKILYVYIFFIIPIQFSFLTIYQVFLGNLIMHVISSYFLSIALIPSHVSEDSEFPLPDKNGLMPHSWSHHQVITTSDFATKNRLTTLLVGGFNHHISHHLFPLISHVHYSSIHEIIKETILEFNLPYKHTQSLFKAYKSHYNLLKKNGKQKSNLI